MARAALTKLFILVILALIICLPEFFSLYRVSKVNFLCQPFQPCDQGDWVKKGAYGNNDVAEINRKDMCDPSQSPDGRHEKWERACTPDNQSNGTDPVLNPRRGGEDAKDNWFMCQTDMDMAALHHNASSSVLKVYLEVSLNLELDSGILNLTLYGRSNDSSLYLHVPEEEDEQNQMNDEGQKESFYCCLPVPPTSESANQSHCLLWLANQTVLTAQEKLPWKRAQKGEWQCLFRVLWLALVFVILLTIVTTVIREVYWQKSTCKNPKVRPAVYSVTSQQKNVFYLDGEKKTETPPKGTIPHTCESHPWSALSPIPECEMQEDIEMLLDGNVDNCYTAKLHHRGHPSTSSLTEEQVWRQMKNTGEELD